MGGKIRGRAQRDLLSASTPDGFSAEYLEARRPITSGKSREVPDKTGENNSEWKSREGSGDRAAIIIEAS